jgi:helix-turn-helix protein
MPDAAASDQLLTLQQVADRLNVSVRHVRSLRQSGALKVQPISSRCVRVTPKDLAEFLAERRAARRSRWVRA